MTRHQFQKFTYASYTGVCDLARYSAASQTQYKIIARAEYCILEVRSINASGINVIDKLMTFFVAKLYKKRTNLQYYRVSTSVIPLQLKSTY